MSKHVPDRRTRVRIGDSDTFGVVEARGRKGIHVRVGRTTRKYPRWMLTVAVDE